MCYHKMIIQNKTKTMEFCQMITKCSSIYKNLLIDYFCYIIHMSTPSIQFQGSIMTYGRPLINNQYWSVNINVNVI